MRMSFYEKLCMAEIAIDMAMIIDEYNGDNREAQLEKFEALRKKVAEEVEAGKYGQYIYDAVFNISFDDCVAIRRAKRQSLMRLSFFYCTKQSENSENAAGRIVRKFFLKNSSQNVLDRFSEK